jgi:hypothetical protein
MLKDLANRYSPLELTAVSAALNRAERRIRRNTDTRPDGHARPFRSMSGKRIVIRACIVLAVLFVAGAVVATFTPTHYQRSSCQTLLSPG